MFLPSYTYFALVHTCLLVALGAIGDIQIHQNYDHCGIDMHDYEKEKVV